MEPSNSTMNLHMEMEGHLCAMRAAMNVMEERKKDKVTKMPNGSTARYPPKMSICWEWFCSLSLVLRFIGLLASPNFVKTFPNSPVKLSFRIRWVDEGAMDIKTKIGDQVQVISDVGRRYKAAEVNAQSLEAEIKSLETTAMKTKRLMDVAEKAQLAAKAAKDRARILAEHVTVAVSAEAGKIESSGSLGTLAKWKGWYANFFLRNLVNAERRTRSNVEDYKLSRLRRLCGHSMHA